MKQILRRYLTIFIAGLFLSLIITCKKGEINPNENPNDSLKPVSIDSLVATKTNIVCWEVIYITAYAKGENLTYLWSTNHGSMQSRDSSTVKYWACYSCVGENTVKCQVSNSLGSAQDSILINVSLEK